MVIYKSRFLNLIKCPKFAYLSTIKSEGTDLNSEEEYEFREFMTESFEEEVDAGGILETNSMNLMREYSKQMETEAARRFQGNIKLQQHFELQNGSNSYRCITDIVSYTEQGIILAEVKGTTTRKFLLMEKKNCPLFVQQPNGDMALTETEDPEIMMQPDYIQLRERLFDREDPVGSYAYDLAYQNYILSRSFGTPLFKSYLAVFNKDYVLESDHVEGTPYERTSDGKELITLIDLTPIMDEYKDIIRRDIATVELYISQENEPYSRIGPCCMIDKDRECEFSNFCLEMLPPRNSVFKYTDKHHGFKDEDGIKHDIYDLINDEHMYGMLDVPITYLNRPNNVIQYEALRDEQPYIDIEKVGKGIESLQYPLYFLDFETYPCPFPRFRGEKPFTQSLFQYSLHIQKDPGHPEACSHYEFLAEDHNDCRENLIRSLVNQIDLSSGGSVVVYNKGFEKSVLQGLANLFPSYEPYLQRIIDNLFDLMYLVKGNSQFYSEMGFSKDRTKTYCYYHPNMEGSFSIKKVLPVLGGLSYENLEVKDGMMAVSVYSNEILLRQKREQLLQYCKQDTLAMVIILENLKKLVF